MIAYNFSVYLFFSQYFGKKTFFFISHMMFLLRLLVLNLPWFLFSRREDEVGAYWRFLIGNNPFCNITNLLVILSLVVYYNLELVSE